MNDKFGNVSLRDLPPIISQIFHSASAADSHSYCVAVQNTTDDLHSGSNDDELNT